MEQAVPIGVTEAPKKELIRGYAEAGTLRLNYSIPKEDTAHKDVLDVMLRTMAGLLKLASWDESCGIMVGAQMRQVLDELMMRLPWGGAEVEAE